MIETRYYKYVLFINERQTFLEVWELPICYG